MSSGGRARAPNGRTRTQNSRTELQDSPYCRDHAREHRLGDGGPAQRVDRWRFPGLIGFTVVDVHNDGISARLEVRSDLLAPNGYLHAATVVGLADTACGFACRLLLPEGATGFTTIELKSNHLGTVRDGAIACRARIAHGGRTTQVWDATVTAEETGKTLALFRCTQAILWPR